MVPEQLKGDEVGGRADEYALALMLYQMLSNEIPQLGAEPLKEIRPDLSIDLSDAVGKAFSANREKRYPDVAGFIAALDVAAKAKTADKPLKKSVEPPAKKVTAAQDVAVQAKQNNINLLGGLSVGAILLAG